MPALERRSFIKGITRGLVATAIGGPSLVLGWTRALEKPFTLTGEVIGGMFLAVGDRNALIEKQLRYQARKKMHEFSLWAQATYHPTPESIDAYQRSVGNREHSYGPQPGLEVPASLSLARPHVSGGTGDAERSEVLVPVRGRITLDTRLHAGT